MASFWSDHLKNKVLDHMRGIATFTPGATSFFCLMTAAPTPLGGGTQAAGLPRLEISNASTSWTAASAGANGNKLEWGFTSNAPADIGVIVGIAEYDAGTGGNLLSYGDLTTPKTLLSGMAFSVVAGAGQYTFVDDVVTV